MGMRLLQQNIVFLPLNISKIVRDTNMFKAFSFSMYFDRLNFKFKTILGFDVIKLN